MELKDFGDWSEKHRQKLEMGFDDLKISLLQPRTYGDAKKLISGYLSESPFGFESQKDLRYRITDPIILREVSILWPHLPKPFKKIVTTADDVEPIEIAMAFFDQGYLCYHTALFWNGLSDQVPTTFFVATERKKPTPRGDPSEVDEFSLSETFMKPPKDTKKVGVFGKNKFALIERPHSDYLGVKEKKVAFSTRPVNVRYTDLERTLLDVAMHPHRGGGILNVIEAFRAAAEGKFRAKKLIDYYEKLEPVYPHWQRIGLIFKIAENKRAEKVWREHFGEPSFRFFLDQPYKMDWPIDEDWNVAYPPGITK